MLPRLTGSFGTIVFFYGGLVILNSAFHELRARRPGISLSSTVAFVFSAVMTPGYPGMPLWEELATLVTVTPSDTGSRCARSSRREGRSLKGNEVAMVGDGVNDAHAPRVLTSARGLTRPV